MKKQIAVLMAAATAVTTVAPVLANADTNNYTSSVSEANAKIQAALNERYKNKTENGYTVSNADDVDAYLNSRYAVAIATDATINNLDDYDVVELDKSVYAPTTQGKATTKANEIGDDIKSAAVEDGKALPVVVVVKDASRVQGLLERIVINRNNNNTNHVKVILVDKGIKDGSAVQTMKEKHYVVSYTNNTTGSETEELLSDAAKTFAANMKTDSKVGYVKELKVSSNTLTTKIKDGVVKNVTVDASGNVDGDVVYDGGSKTERLSAVEVSEIKVTLESGKEYTLGVNDKAFNLEKAVDAKNNQIDLTKANAQNVLDQIEGFEYLANKDDKSVTLTLPIGDTDVYSVNDVQASVIELGKIFTSKEGYTKEGADLVNGIVKSRNSVEKSDGITTFNFRNVNYQYVAPTKNTSANDLKNIPAPVIEKSGNGYVLKYTIKVNDMTNGYNGLYLQFVINGESQKDLAIVLKNLQGSSSVVAGKFNRLMGANRYETAVAVSQETFDPETANTVVIAGGEALMDGLSAVPLASIHKAPILLSNPKTGLDDATIKEIKRVTKSLNRKTVYVVGGENSVPKKAVEQLEEMGAVVERLSGTDRYETSLEISRNLVNNNQANEIFVVGGEGAADAMSASPVAATIVTDKNNNKTVAPILVVPKTGVKKSTREFVAGKFTSGYVIGGEGSVSSDVYRALVSGFNGNAPSLVRVAGSDRYDTNVQLLKRFYLNKEVLVDSLVKGTITKEDAITPINNEIKNTGTYNGKIVVNGAIFTSGDNKYLVDAQTAGPLAVKESAPIVLTGAKLTNDQVNLLKDNGVLANVSTNVYQVGGVVSADVMSVVVDKLGL